MRRQRIEWLKSFFPFVRGKRSKKPKEKRAKAEPKNWWYELPNGSTGRATEFTRSEVRARIKQTHGLKRVPVGTAIEQV